ncbi:MAG TPA: hypothetical protein VH092_30405 [Urbifossiella sp.]|nr:hypothetical protein [Urbifossiella sp.]
MAIMSVWSVVREILSADLTLPADAVIAKAKANGVKAPDAAIRTTVHTLRKRLKKKAAQPPKPVAAAAAQPPKLVPAAARQTVVRPAAAPAAAPATPATPAVADVLSNVAQVHAAAAACGGVEHARQVAEAVRACGGPDGFLQYLDLVAGIRTGGA